MVARPASIEELSEVVRERAAIRLSLGGWDLDCVPSDLELSGLTGIVELSPEDMVVTVRSGTTLGELQTTLAEHGLCLPMPMQHPFLTHPGMTLADHLALNLPHGLDSQCGSWRDWVLGMRLMLADGMICTSGSKVVKSVAGYDVHKLMIGARHSLAIVAEVTLKVLPLAAMPKSSVKQFGEPSSTGYWVHRVLPTDYQACVSSYGDRVLFVDPAASVVWAKGSDAPKRFRHDVVVGNGFGSLNCSLSDPVARHLFSRAKAVLDPTNKFNPGAIGPL
ncbi:MAG: FAD-binding oxidoreductase [Fimbriimonadaceae bacterium]|nr:FAD-binding oxidoreductase [Fimbriimonadaceae bacterium]